jgi:mannose-6-phosphate isomerase-like protein (cupin superfamily)
MFMLEFTFRALKLPFSAHTGKYEYKRSKVAFVKRTECKDLPMKPAILKFDQASEFETEERCHISELLRESTPADLTVARARVEPGVTTAWHQLKGTVERYIITQGNGVVEVGELPPAPVSPGDIVVIPADVRQRITNTGPQDLLFLCLCTPGFSDECYVSLDR